MLERVLASLSPDLAARIRYNLRQLHRDNDFVEIPERMWANDALGWLPTDPPELRTWDDTPRPTSMSPIDEQPDYMAERTRQRWRVRAQAYRDRKRGVA